MGCRSPLRMRQNVTTYTYDVAANRTSTTYVDGSVERAAYDAIGNPTSIVNRRKQTTTREFNAAGQVTKEFAPDGSTTTFTYDAGGRLTTTADSSGRSTFTYNPAGRLIRADYPNGRWIAYQYDAAGHRTRKRIAAERSSNTATILSEDSRYSRTGAAA